MRSFVCSGLALLCVLLVVPFIGGCPAIPGSDLCAGVECDDGLFCNGEESCLNGECASSSSLPCGAGEVCDEEANDCVPSEPQAFLDADAARGGAMYDKWWAVAGVDAPTEDHALWAMQSTNTRSGGDTWRCKECHGWDYKGADGAYGPSSSHHTGFTGISGTPLSAQGVFDTIKVDHGLGTTGLSDTDIWDLAKFVLDGQINTDDMIDANGAFTGTATAGQTVYDSTCMACHGADGLAIPPGADEDHDDFVGKVANENPWEFQHKVRFGQPGTSMPAQFGILDVNGVADLGAHAQTLPDSAEPKGFLNASVARGGAMYDKWWVVAELDAPTEDHTRWAMQTTNMRSGADTWRCKECHGWDYKGAEGAYGPSNSHYTGFTGISGNSLDAQGTFDRIKDGHGFGAAGLTDDDIWDLARFVQDGLIDTDEIIDADGMFVGDGGLGQTLYDDGIGGNIACTVCHGAQGLTAPPGAAADYGDFVGKVANDNPWEFQHKVRFGQPGTTMPLAYTVGASTEDVANLGVHAQTLPPTAQ